ncbi:hypothetical protein ACFWNL_18390 [Kitasatospora sp. NPDC058397]|uniref:hypothetical protein n=1 Tax=unclassified Kitasatospora TaxID=2633591 RepID=UPI003661754B
MTGDDGTACTTDHYSVPARCTLSAGHPGPWHRAFHPGDGRTLRWSTAGGVHHTQEWEPDDDPGGAADAGEWVTWDYVAPRSGPGSTVSADDLDRRAASLVSSHFPTGRVRPGPAGVESECGCGTWYTGHHNGHFGREVSLLARSFFDLGLREGAAAGGPARTV